MLLLLTHIVMLPKNKKLYSSAARVFDRIKGTPVYSIGIYELSCIYDFAGEAIFMKYMCINSELIKKKIYIYEINSMIDEEHH